MPPRKTKIGRRGYVVLKDECTPEELKRIRADLTVSPIVLQFGPFPVKPPSIQVYREGPTKMYLPRHYGVDAFGPARKSEFPELSPRTRLHFEGALRENQVDVVDKSMTMLADRGSAFMCLPCGYGKTSVSLYLACQLKQRTLVVVHKSFLMDQWVERIRQFIPKAKVGVIRGSKIEVGDNDIVIGMLQSLSMKDYEEETFSAFGTVICDEAHHVSSEVFSQALPKIQTRYMIGLSATPQRKDGLSCIMHWFLGPMTVKIVRKDDMGLMVQRLLLPHPKGLAEVTNARGQVQLSTMTTQLGEHDDRNRYLARLARNWVLEHPTRQVIILGNRIGQLQNLKARLDDMKIVREDGRAVTTGYYIGGGGASKKKQQELKDSEGCDIILGTMAMACEGLDIPSLNTLIFASPAAEIEQAVGRILRRQHAIRPVVVDPVDVYSSSIERQSWKRLRFYKKNGYPVQTTRVDAWNLDLPHLNTAMGADIEAEEAADAEDAAEPGPLEEEFSFEF